MDSLVRGVLLILAVLFVFVFGGMTLYALSRATWTIGSVISFGLAFLVLALVAIGLIGAIRNPPDR